MLTRPPDVGDDAVVDALAVGWGIDVGALSYLPLGFGSHHWDVRARDGRWFVTVDDLESRRVDTAEPRASIATRLVSALETARTVADRGLDFVVAPLQVADGVVRPLDDRYLLAVYPYVDGVCHTWGEDFGLDGRRAVLDLVVQLHAVPDPRGTTPAGVDGLTIPRVDDLRTVLDGDGGAGEWDRGPHGAAAGALLARHGGAVDRALATYERLAEDVLARPERMVLTHGEPHPGNVIHTPAGWRLVDWDTTLIAPPERDLWITAGGHPAVAAAYEAATGRVLLDDAMDCFGRRWVLTDIALYVALLRDEHDDTADVVKSLHELRAYLEGLERASA